MNLKEDLKPRQESENIAHEFPIYKDMNKHINKTTKVLLPKNKAKGPSKVQNFMDIYFSEVKKKSAIQVRARNLKNNNLTPFFLVEKQQYE